MRHLMFAMFTMLGLCLATPALAQDDPAPEATTEAPAAEGGEDEAAPAPEEGGDDAAPAEGEEKAEEPAADAEGDDKADEGEEKTEDEAKAPETDEEAVETAVALIDAIKEGKWPLAVGLLLTLLVYLVNRFALKDKVGEKAIPWVAGGVGAAGAVGTALMTGEPVVEALTLGVAAAVAAIGGWEAVLKHVTGGSKADEPTEEKPKEGGES